MKGKLANGVGSQSNALYVDLVVSIPCVTVCHHSSTGLYRSLSAQRLSELPLPCVTVCHHSSTGLYRILSTKRLSERTVFLTQHSLVQSGALENISLLKRALFHVVCLLVTHLLIKINYLVIRLVSLQYTLTHKYAFSLRWI